MINIPEFHLQFAHFTVQIINTHRISFNVFFSSFIVHTNKIKLMTELSFRLCNYFVQEDADAKNCPRLQIAR